MPDAFHEAFDIGYRAGYAAGFDLSRLVGDGVHQLVGVPEVPPPVSIRAAYIGGYRAGFGNGCHDATTAGETRDDDPRDSYELWLEDRDE